MMDDMTLGSAKRRNHARTGDADVRLLVEEAPYVRRVLVATDTHRWRVTLPVDGYAYDLVQYQVASDDAQASAVVELKLDGATYRRAVGRLSGSAGDTEIREALSVLLGPLAPLMSLVETPPVPDSTTRPTLAVVS